MAKCYHCGEVLSDSWIMSQGASIMGRAGGQKKKRKNARKAAQARWAKEKKKE